MQQRTEEITFATSAQELTGRGQPRTLKEGIDFFFVLHVAKKSDSYRDWLEPKLRSLAAFLGPELLLERITIWQLELWFAELQGRDTLYEDHPHRDPVNRGLSQATLRGYVKAVRTLFSWLGKRRVIHSNPAALLELPKKPKRRPKHATQAEVDALLAHFDQSVNYLARRNYVAIKVLTTTGLRASELTGLEKRQVSIAERVITVLGKGDKERSVPLSQEVAPLLDRYMQSHFGRFVFVNRSDREWTSHGLRLMMRQASNTLDLRRVVTPHMLRHYFGFESTRRGMPLRTLQQIMGHEDSKTTEIYTEFAAVELRGAYDNYW